MKTKSIALIEEKMQGLEPGSLRYEALSSARDFKSSWIRLGQYLCSVYGDKRFKEWGYLTFEAYCAKEIGIRYLTAVKLLKSYSFLEREESGFLKRTSDEDFQPCAIPGFEAVNALRLAKDNQKLSKGDYESIREDVLEKAKEGKEVRQKLRYILKNRTEADDSNQSADGKTALAKRLVGGLKRAKEDLTRLGFPKEIVRQVDTLVELLSRHLSS